VLWAAFSHLSTVTVEEVVVDDGLMTFSARTATRQAVSPGYGTVSGRVHGGYRRRLAYMAVSGHWTVIDLLVRRFICSAEECDRRTLVEQVDGLTERFARRTASLHRALEKIALALAGRPAARLAAHLSIPTSPNSLLRLLRKLPDEPIGTAPRVLGVDDFAFRRATCTERSFWTWRRASAWTCCLTAPRKHSRTGCARIQGWPKQAVLPRPRVMPICGAASPMPLPLKSCASAMRSVASASQSVICSAVGVRSAVECFGGHGGLGAPASVFHRVFPGW
jgi:hypothetical protein